MTKRSQTYLREQAESLAAALPPLLVAAERLASAVNLGVHGRRKAGIGESFWQFRRYQSEDPTAAIDWRQSAKSQHLFVREREWEAAEAVWFWRDGSPTMRFSSADERKIDRASLLAVALASLLIRGGERVAILGEGRAPSTSRATLERMAQHFSSPKADDESLPPNAAMGRNAQFVWISDFLAPAGEVEATMRRIAREGLTGHLLGIVDPAEEDFPYFGRTQFESVVGNENEVFGKAETVRDSYRKRFRAHRETVAALARRLGWTCLFHRTDKRPETALFALFVNLAGPDAKLFLGRPA